MNSDMLYDQYKYLSIHLHYSAMNEETCTLQIKIITTDGPANLDPVDQ